MRRTARITLLLAASLVVWAFLLRTSLPAPGGPTGAHPSILRTMPRAKPNPESVMAVGGSVAHGWVDPKGGGYLKRAFTELSQKADQDYILDNKSIVGANSTQLQITLYKGDYEKWLGSVKPQVTVLSWGLLNDAYPKTPFSRFDSTIRQEIREALDRHSVVFVVTPPITKASYTQFLTQEPEYVNSEVYLADSFNSPNVQVFDVFDQMKAYLAAHHQTYKPYAADGWHPNAAGHELAASLLSQDLWRRYGSGPIRFVQQPTATASARKSGE